LFIFGQAGLGDPRRTKRLIQLTSDMAENASSSIVKACSSPAKIEAAYRFVRNGNISPGEIVNAGFEHTCEIIKQRLLVLAIQDTTGLTVNHKVTEGLGDVCCSKNKGVFIRPPIIIGIYQATHNNLCIF
jgi:hypothetical protein